MKSPCIGCEFEHKDKNNDLCANCEKRIKYAEEQLMIPNEAAEADRAAREEMRKIKELKAPGKKRGPKPKSDLKGGFELFEPNKKKGRAQKTILKAESSRKGIYIRPTEFCSEIMIEEIIQGIQEIANSQLRSLPQQVLWILKEKVEEWKKEHGTIKRDN